MKNEKGIILVDLDGTLAYHFVGDFNPLVIGDPIPEMVNKVKKLIEEDEVEVRIFTARAVNVDDTYIVIKWCKKYLGKELKVTNVKDYNCIEIWDDRARQVIMNTGYFVE